MLANIYCTVMENCSCLSQTVTLQHLNRYLETCPSFSAAVKLKMASELDRCGIIQRPTSLSYLVIKPCSGLQCGFCSRTLCLMLFRVDSVVVLCATEDGLEADFAFVLAWPPETASCRRILRDRSTCNRQGFRVRFCPTQQCRAPDCKRALYRRCRVRCACSRAASAQFSLAAKHL